MQIPEQTAEHYANVIASIDADMLALANRIAASTAPDDARGEIAYAIARYLKLGWPSAEVQLCCYSDCVEPVSEPGFCARHESGQS
jgi:hypothetical protein